MRYTITRIPIPSVILEGGWCNIVYAIETRGFEELREHQQVVGEKIRELEDEFDKGQHESVSLRLVKTELVYTGYEYFVSLVQFRVRDSY